MAAALEGHIVKIKSWDVRFPTSKEAHGSDAMHGLVDYSCVYVQIFLDSTDLTGCGLTFTCGRGNEIVKHCVDSLKHKLIGQKLVNIVNNFGEFAHSLCNDNQMRWLGPECGVLSLASCAILNAIWDLWAKVEKKPVWLLLCEMSAEVLVKCGIWTHLSDVMTPKEALKMLQQVGSDHEKVTKRIGHVKEHGVQSYTTACGWLGYTDDYMSSKIKSFMEDGWTCFKIKVGVNIEEDVRRCKMVRDLIGPEGKLMIDCNQKWEVEEAIEWVSKLSPYGIYWTEEPTHPSDVIGHKKIRDGLRHLGVKVATGEVCSNRVMFKQLCSEGAIDICQIDCARVLSINELIPILLMSKKYNITVCPHAGGVGLCEMVQHVSAFNYVRVAPEENPDNPVLVEHAEHLAQHFEMELDCKGGAYRLPTGGGVGYSTTMKDASLVKYSITMSE